MSINLLDLVKGQVSSSLIDKAAGLLGESPQAVSKGLLGSSGILLSSLAKKLTDSDTAESVFNGLGQGNILSSFEQQLAGGNNTVNFLRDGLDKAKGLLGGNTDSIVSALSQSSGLRSESASSLLGMAAPLVTGILGKQKASGMSLAAMSNLVSEQSESFDGLLPDGMDTSALSSLGILGSISSTLGEAWDKTTIVTGNIADTIGDAAGSLKDATGNVISGAADVVGDAAGAAMGAAGAAVDKVGDIGHAAADAVGDVAGAAADVAGAAAGKVGDLASGAIDGVGDLATASAGGLGRLIPWILAGLAALFAVFFFRSCSQGDSMTDAMKDAASGTTEMVKDAGSAVKDTAGAAVDATGEMAGKAVDAAGDAASATMDAASDAAKATGDMMEAGVDKLAAMGKKIGDKFRFALPGGVNVDVPDGSFEATMLRNFAENKAEYGKAYVLDRIYFDTGSYNLTSESADQLKTMAAILNAYPDLTANLRGHTDNTGSADGNLALSLNRANAVKTYLEGLNVRSSRITTVGKGSAEPIADNGTAEGKALNRRIDISFTK